MRHRDPGPWSVHGSTVAALHREEQLYKLKPKRDQERKTSLTDLTISTFTTFTMTASATVGWWEPRAQVRTDPDTTVWAQPALGDTEGT